MLTMGNGQLYQHVSVLCRSVADGDGAELRPMLSDYTTTRALVTGSCHDDVVVMDWSVHRQMMSDLDSYRTSLLHLQQVLLQQQQVYMSVH